MKKKRQIYFLFTGEQWLGLFILCILIVGTLVAIKHLQPKPTQDSTWLNDSTQREFAIYQHQQDSIRKAQWKKQYHRDTIEIHMQAFDPNTSDSSTLVHLGLKKWQVSNMLKYRAKGGKYRKPEDLKKLYGMTDSLYQALAPYIQIATDTIKPDSTVSILDSIAHKYPLYTPKKDTIINLRTADTTELKMIRGIGSYRARLIVNYRQRLGGFTSVEQLQEIPELANIVDSISSSFIIDSIIVDPIHVNSASIRYLARHPYLRYEQAKAIYELRRKKIRLHSAKQLESIPGLDSVTIEKLLPYLHFEKKD